MRAVRDISIEDAANLVRGRDTAVTDFFSVQTRQPLRVAMRPVVTQATDRLSLASRYNALLGKVFGEPGRQPARSPGEVTRGGTARRAAPRAAIR